MQLMSSTIHSCYFSKGPKGPKIKTRNSDFEATYTQKHKKLLYVGFSDSNIHVQCELLSKLRQEIH